MRAGSFSLPVPIYNQDRRESHNSASNDEEAIAPSERTALLSQTMADSESTLIESPETNPNPAPNKSTKLILVEFWILFRGSIPVILAYTLQNSLQTISVLIVGRLSPEALATAAFAYMFAMATGWLIALGGTTAIDTLASASFTGSKNPHDLGIILQRAYLILALFYIPVAVLWIFAEPVFKVLGQEEYLARDAAKFLTVLVPGGLGYIYFECMKKFLQAQEIMRPGTYVLLLTSPLNAALNYLFIHNFKLGLLGAPAATGISYWLSFLLLISYARFVAGWECWGGWSKKCFHNMGTFARLSILGVVHVGTEWWAFEIVAIVAGQLGTIALASQSVIMTADQVSNFLSLSEVYEKVFPYLGL
jgi:MATE family, multidrug and toxin extrusion protein